MSGGLRCGVCVCVGVHRSLVLVGSVGQEVDGLRGVRGRGVFVWWCLFVGVRIAAGVCGPGQSSVWSVSQAGRLSVW
jgi:hypothetical protein